MDSNLSFGLQKKYSLILGTGKIGSIYPINAYEKIVTTNKEFVKIEDTTIKKSFNGQFSTSLFIEEANLIVAVSAQKSELYVFTLNDPSNPIIANYPTCQLGIFHIIYSKQSSVLLTFGFGVKIWNFKITIPDRRRSTLKPTVNISLRYSFSGDDLNPILSPEVSGYEASILIPPSFDYSDEIVFLPSSKGILGYDMNGRQKAVMYRLPCSNKTAYCYFEEKKEMLVYDTTNGLILCTTSGFVQSRPLVGTTTLIWMDFLDSENALLMDAKGSFYILDLKTGRSFHCYSVLNSTSSTSTVTQTKDKKPLDPTLSMMAVLGQPNSMSGLCEINGGYGGISTANRMPSRVFLLRNSKEICMCFGPKLETFKIDIPWTLWAVNISKTNTLKRIEKPGEAARILAFTSNSFVKIFSPKDGKILTDATPKSLSTPSDFFYDRGYLIYYQSRDDKDRFMVKKVHETQTEERLFIILDDGSISIFDPHQNPCKEIGNGKIKANSMTVCYFNHEFCYALSSFRGGEVYLVDKANCSTIKKKFSISRDSFCGLLFDPISITLVCVMDRETVLFDLQSQKVVYRLPLKGTKLVSLNNGVLYYGYDNGDINFVKVENSNSTKSLQPMTKEPNRLHFDSVTGFAFSQSFWVSVSADQTVRYWDYNNSNFFTINMPCRLFGCEIINGKRDVVVGTDNELMMIDGKTVFDGEIDEVEPLIDNFDKECDEFQKVLIENVLRMKREEELREKQRRAQVENEEREKLRRLQQKSDDRNKHKHKRLNLSKEGDKVLRNLEDEQKIDSQKVEPTELTDELKAQMKEEEEKRRNKAFEAMMNITDHDRKFRQKALQQLKEKEEERSKPSWSIKINSKTNKDSDTLTTSPKIKNDNNNKDDADGEETDLKKNETDDEKSQIKTPSLAESNTGCETSGNEHSHAPRRKKKKRVHHLDRCAIEEAMSKTQTDEIQQVSVPSKAERQQTDEDAAKIKSSLAKVGENKAADSLLNGQTKSNRETLTKSQAYKTTSTETDSVDGNSPNESQITDNQPLLQPPKADSTSTTSIRNKKFIQTVPRRANIATSPISSMNSDAEEEDQPQPQQQQQSVKPSRPVRNQKKRDKEGSFSSSHNFLRKNNFKQRFPTPPQVVRRSYYSGIKDRRPRRPRSSQGTRKSGGFFEMPSPQIVLDFDAVRSQFGRGKVELLPLVRRIESDTIQSSRLNKLSDISVQCRNDLLATNGSNNSSQNEKVRPLIEQPKKQIFTPLTANNRNKSLGKVKKQFPSRTSRRPLGHYENSVTVLNSANPTPRQLIPKFKKSSSSAENKKNKNLNSKDKHKDKE